jgi:hypothetical protein
METIVRYLAIGAKIADCRNYQLVNGQIELLANLCS